MDEQRYRHFPGVEWDGLDTKWEVEQVTESEHLPSGLAKIEMWRDEAYRIKAKMIGMSGQGEDARDKLLPKVTVGRILPPIEIEGADSTGDDRYHLRECDVYHVQPYMKSRFPVPHIMGDPRFEYDPYYEAWIAVRRCAR